jgi:tetratricopeptide (TPR) repeat protein
MRSDFYDRLETLPAVARFAGEETCYRLLPPDDNEVGQIIRQPAREAGLRFEYDTRQAVSLDEVIRQATAKDRGALPLLSFLLDQLWRRRSERGELTFAAYRELDGLEGALGRRAREVFGDQPEEVQAALPRLLRALVTVGQGPRAVIAARPCPLDNFPADGPERQLIAAFLAPEARLLVADEGETHGGGPRVRVAHEALLTHWDRARDWISERPADLQLEERLEAEATRWAAASEIDKPSLLRPHGLPLVEAEDLLARHRDELSDSAIAFVDTSVAAEGERQAAETRRIEAEEALRREAAEAEARRLRQEAEAAREREAAARSIAARTRIGLVAALALMLIATGFAVLSYERTKEARENFNAAKDAVDGLVYNVAQGLRNVAGMRVETIDAILDTVKKIIDQLVAKAPDNRALGLTQVAMLNDFVDTYLKGGDPTHARDAANQSVTLARQLVSADGKDNDAARVMVASLYKSGDVSLAEKDWQSAFAKYKDSVDEARRLAGRARDRTRAQICLWVAVSKLGEAQLTVHDPTAALASFENSLTIAREIAARYGNTPEPSPLSVVEYPSCSGAQVGGSPQARRNLSVTLSNIGRAKRDKSDLAGARTAFEKSLAIRRNLVAEGPDNTLLKRDLAIALDDVGDVKLQSNDGSGALRVYQEAFSIRRTLVNEDQSSAQAQRDLAVSLNHLAEIKKLTGDQDGALDEYQKCLQILLKLPADASSAIDIIEPLSSTVEIAARWEPLYDKALSAVSAVRGGLTAEQQHRLVLIKAQLAALPR